jgi:hypothetical protein
MGSLHQTNRGAREVTSYMLQCGFDTMAQCLDMSSGRGGDCLRNPALEGASDAFAHAPMVRKHHHQ